MAFILSLEKKATKCAARTADLSFLINHNKNHVEIVNYCMILSMNKMNTPNYVGSISYVQSDNAVFNVIFDNTINIIVSEMIRYI